MAQQPPKAWQVRIVNSLKHSSDWHHVHARDEATAIERTKRQAREEGVTMEIVELQGWTRTNTRRVHPDGSVVGVPTKLEEQRALGRAAMQAAKKEGVLGTTVTLRNE